MVAANMKALVPTFALFGAICGGALALSCDPTPQSKEVVEVKQETSTMQDKKATAGIPILLPKKVRGSVSIKSPEEIENYWQAICTKSKTRGCSMDFSHCASMCREMILEPECRGEMGQVLECLAGLGDAYWQCGDEGFPEVLPGQCDAEQESVVLCLSVGLK